MGQQQTSQCQDYFSDIIGEEPILSLFSEEIHSLTYEKFLLVLRELNSFSKKSLDSDEEQLVFAVKKGTDSTLFWKATVQIACVKIDSVTERISVCRYLNLYEFLKIFKTLKCQLAAEEQSKKAFASSVGATISKAISEYNANTSDASSKEQSKECCICLERMHEVILPCTHSYCLPCIEQWNEAHDTCPICREKLESTDDTWVISEAPNAEEISKVIKSCFLKLAED